MATLTETPRSRKVSKSVRSLRISDAINGVRTLVITQDGDRVFYTLKEIPCEIGGRGFRLDKTLEASGSDREESSYDVRVDGQADGSCTCKGWTYHKQQKPCKHIAAVQALVRLGKL
jgi:hypothetical protein